MPVHIDSIERELDSSTVAPLAFKLLAKAQTMGFMPSGASERVKLNRRLLVRIAHVLESDGVAIESGARLRQLSAGRSEDEAEGTAEWERALQEILEAVAASPRPHGEWQPARDLLGDELLARVLGGISISSLRRYAAGTRTTPDDIAWRLHVVATVLSSILGSYNDYGVRRWFDRRRSRLNGATPAEAIAQAQNESDELLQTTLALADQLTG